MRFSRRLLPSLVLLAVVMTLLLTAGCGSGGSASGPSPTPVPGGTYIVPLDGDPAAIEPLNAYDAASTLVNHQVFQGLVHYETASDGTVRGVPGLAESWSVNEDATVWTFALKKGVMFQPPVDREVTAQDFVDDWNYVTRSGESALSYILSPIKGTDVEGNAEKGLSGVEVLGRYTLRITLKYPFADFPLVLGHPATAVWPRDYMEEVSHEAFRNKPVGTGPYLVDRWVHGEYVDLVRNPDYWDKEHAGYVDRIHLPIMDVTTQWQQFQKGKIDFTSVPPEQVAAARDDPKVRDGSWKATAWPQLTIILIGMNQKSPRVGGKDNLTLREALSRSADRAAVMAIKGDEASASPVASVPATGLVPDGILHRDAGGLVYPFDLEKARQLVARVSPLPALRYLSWGTVPLASRGLSSLDAPLLSGWRSARLDIERKGYEWNTYVRKLAAGSEGDLFVAGWVADYPSPDDFLHLLFHSGSSGAGTLCTFYGDPQVDRLLDEARGTLDESRRLDLYAEAERQILSDAPVIPLYFYRAFRVANTRVQNQVLDPMGAMDMWRVWVK